MSEVGMMTGHPNPALQTVLKRPLLFDKWLLLSAVAIIVMGLVMVASASIVVSERQFHNPFHFLVRQIIYLIAGGTLAIMMTKIPIKFYRKFSFSMFLLSMVLLFLVLVPGLGKQVNGSARWLGIGPIGFQVSEIVKLFFILYLADYLVRREKEVQNQVLGFLKPIFLVGVMGILLLKEPDFGAASVIMATTLAMMFLAGVRVSQFLVLLFVVCVVMAIVAISSPYRMARLTAVLNPWGNQYNTGYQLTQSLIAFGRGGWFGVGLGDSIQKLFYLPEAHTDFVFAVFAEEMGLVGVLAVLMLYVLLVARGILIAYRAILLNRKYQGYVAYGLSFWFATQALINICVNSGLLPTKGLTLPLISYGGSSLMVMCLVIGLLFRIDYENRLQLLRQS